MVSVETMGRQIDFSGNYITESTTYFSLLKVTNYLQFHLSTFIDLKIWPWKNLFSKLGSPKTNYNIDNH